MKKNISKKSSLVSALIIAVVLSVLATTFAVFAEESIPEENTATLTDEVTDNSDGTIANNSEEIAAEDNGLEEITVEDNGLEEIVVEDNSSEVIAAEDNGLEVITVEDNSSEVIAIEDNGSEVIAVEDNSSIEPSNNEILVVDEINNENLEDQENVVEVTEELLTAEELAVVNTTTQRVESVHYNAIYLGGLNIDNTNWDHIEITVTNVKTGEAQEGYLNYQNNSALLGYLTSGSFMDSNSVYTIEIQICMPNEEVIVINGSSTGAASNGNGYSTISFTAEGNTAI